MASVVRRHQDLEVHQRTYATAMRIFDLSKTFPIEEKYSLTDQMRRSSRSVTANIAEAWMRRRYEASSIARLTDSLGEVAETCDWLAYARDCGYLDGDAVLHLMGDYEKALKTLNAMILHAPSWCSKEAGYKPQLPTRANKPQATPNKPQSLA